MYSIWATSGPPNRLLLTGAIRSASFIAIQSRDLREHALAVDHILDTLLVPDGPRAECPELNHVPARGSAHRSSERSKSEMPKRCFGRSFLSISTQTYNPASQGRQPKPGQ